MASQFADIPSVDKVISDDACQNLISKHGIEFVTATTRVILEDIRSNLRSVNMQGVNTHGVDKNSLSLATIIDKLAQKISQESEFSLKPVINLTGTVLHTNLGRAALPQSAIEAIVTIAGGASNLEFDLARGKRGDRDEHIEKLITELTGAEAATIVNNNAAAVLLTLNTLAMGKEVPVSRGELVEIGGSFRIPEIMARSGCKLVEVGATNRTHLKDYEQAIGKETALLMKVHTSNYEIKGFTKTVADKDIALLATKAGIPFVIDLGSGTLVDLSRFGLPHEPTAREAIESGAEVVTFSGDKLLGGPQAGIIIGKRSLIAAIKANPLKRALRVDKLTIAALFEVLSLYRDPDGLTRTLPTLKYLARSLAEINQLAEAVLPAFSKFLGDKATVVITDTFSQIGSGSLPLDRLPSRSISISSNAASKSDRHLQELAALFRTLPVPIIGRLNDGKLLFDLRTLESAEDLIRQLGKV